ncbi:unnamed protein product [Dimorphilus gyrociliatus]|uniref:Battenin n=1 Tax=Dimorphilus gyrociliatus TaxID=2664684 RepID=A0A7I8W7A0_9ANNE|nr:unnamed protein product [Dimorphilus gyrociliatus]
MLSAAHDILESKENSTDAIDTNSTNTNTSYHLVCNPISTGAILLADILPTVIIKLTAPFYMQKIPYNIRVRLVCLFAAGSFIIVALSKNLGLSLFGVVCASLSSGFGEITFLSMTSFYNKKVVSTWSSGTGMAGLAGALSYVGLLSAGLTPKNTLLLMLVVPAIFLLTYELLLYKLHNVSRYRAESSLILPTEENAAENSPFLFDDDIDNDIRQERKSHENIVSLFCTNARLIKGLILPYMLPLAIVYFAEYFINQALFELLQFHSKLTFSEQYRWYQALYQAGVFISRSSVNLIRIRYLWLMPVLQTVNLVLLLCQTFFHFIPSVWIVMILIAYEGLLGGAAYVNTFYSMTEEVPEENLEFCLGVATVSDSLGITIAGFVSLPVHNAICSRLR